MLTLQWRWLLNWIVNLHSVIQIGECSTERTEEPGVVGKQHWPDAFVVIYVRAGRDKE